MGFTAEFLLNPKTTGSVVPSSPFLIKSMLNDVDFKNAKCIVELGAGTGVITSELAKRIPNNCRLIVFEINKKFADFLKNRFKEAIIINDSVENINSYAYLFNDGKVDYFISSLPIALWDKNASKNLPNQIHALLKENGKFVQYQYSLKSKKMLGSVFNNLAIKFVLLNIPPAFVYTCSK